jgi:hypothetical protein
MAARLERRRSYTRFGACFVKVIIPLKGDTIGAVIATLAMLPLMVSPMLINTEALSKRLSFVLLGVALIFGLSEISKQYEKWRTAANPAAVTQEH